MPQIYREIFKTCFFSGKTSCDVWIIELWIIDNKKYSANFGAVEVYNKKFFFNVILIYGFVNDSAYLALKSWKKLKIF